MNQLLDDLVKVMTLERLELDLFRGESRDIGSPQVFGGQVLGQALMAASATVDGRAAHSLHAYFLRRGDFNSPIVYEVDRARDGNHFSTRRVVAIQHGAQIFNLSASFQSAEEGLDHQLTMPPAPAPETLPDLASYYRDILPRLAPAARRVLDKKRPFEFRPTEPPSFLMAALANVAAPAPPADPSAAVAPASAVTLAPAVPPAGAQRSIWFRAVARLPDDDALHRCLLAYVSDFNLLDTALMPHGISFGEVNLVMASIDHAMWFHRSVRVDDWLLYCTDSPSAGGARGFSRGSIFARDGRLVASTSQEGLMRLVSP
jgi:acyl-CoA thioesterase-2